MLGKDFPFQGYGLEVKTKTPNGVLFKVAGNQSSSSSIINGDLEGKYVDRKHGVTFTQAWTTSNVLKSTIELENQIAKGLKLDINSSLLPEKGAKTALITAIYKQSGFHTRAALDVFKVCPSVLSFLFNLHIVLLYQGPTFTADTVLGRDGFLVGGEASYNVTEGNITKYAAAVGYNAPEYAVTLHGLNNLNAFTASYYHRVSPDVEAGAKAVYDSKATQGGVALEVGAKA